MRRGPLLLALLLGLAVAPAAQAHTGSARRIDAPTARAGFLPPTAWGGVYRTAATGEPVKVYLSAAYPVDPARAQQWADFLGSLVHGPELSLLTLYLAPASEIASVCGGDSLACYAVGRDFLMAPAEDPGGGLTAQSVVAHEYGHHIAANRRNPPWSANGWGTKRWATYIGVCQGVRRHQLFPGAEQSLLYTLNPGEAFAEDYRVLNEHLLGLPESPWQVVDDSLYPDQEALSLLEQDVKEPWRQAPATTLHARGTHTFAVATPEDGTLVVHTPTRGLRIAVLSRGRVVATGATSVRYVVCGVRSLSVRVTGDGSYTLSVTKP